MKSYLVAALLCSAGLAQASEHLQIFDHPHADEDALRVAREVPHACSFSEMSRIGPNPSQIAACNAAEQKLLAFGKRGAAAAMHELDANEDLRGGSVQRYYDVIARSGDLSNVGKLVTAYEKIDSGAITERNWERYHIQRALETLTHARLGDNPSAKQWRAWADEHEAKAKVQPAHEKDGTPLS